MVTVYKNNDTKIVTKGAYESFYKPLGYKIMLEAKVVEEVKPIEKVEKIEKVTKDKKYEIPNETKNFDVDDALAKIDVADIIKKARSSSNKKNKKEA